MEPKTKQYGSHMVMTNVQKNSKTKLLAQAKYSQKPKNGKTPKLAKFQNWQNQKNGK